MKAKKENEWLKEWRKMNNYGNEGKWGRKALDFPSDNYRVIRTGCVKPPVDTILMVTLYITWNTTSPNQPSQLSLTDLGTSARIQRCLLMASMVYLRAGSRTSILRTNDSQSEIGKSEYIRQLQILLLTETSVTVTQWDWDTYCLE